MSRPTPDRHSEMQAGVDRTSSTLRIDGETLEALSITGRTSRGDSSRIVRWFETWSGADR